MFNVDWCSAFSNCITIGEHADIFYDILNECIDRFVPLSCSRREDYGLSSWHSLSISYKNARLRKEAAGVFIKDFEVLFSICVTNRLAHSVAKLFFSL